MNTVVAGDGGVDLYAGVQVKLRRGPTHVGRHVCKRFPNTCDVNLDHVGKQHRCPNCNVDCGDLRLHYLNRECTQPPSQRFIEELQQVTFDRLVTAHRGPNYFSTSCSACQARVSPYPDDTSFFLSNCEHKVCHRCVETILANAKVSLWSRFQCPVAGCECSLLVAEVRLLMPAAVVDELEKSSIDTFLQAHGTRTDATEASSEFNFRIVTCPCCGVPFEHVTAVKQQRSAQTNPKQHFAEYRVRCRHCSSTMCTECQRFPYHDGHTCESFLRTAEMLSCRFCSAEVQPPVVNSTGATEPAQRSLLDRVLRRRPLPVDCCADSECATKALTVCNKLLPCGHPCYLAADASCGPCLVDGCHAAPLNVNATREDLCNICYVDELRAGPCLPFRCGHVVHASCFEARLRNRWTSHRVGFNYLQCPLCATTIDADDCEFASPSLKEMVAEHTEYRKALEDKMLKRLVIEGLDKDPSLTDPSSSYFQQPLKFAIKTLAFYECFKCRRPYFGGLQRCEAVGEANDQVEREQLVCAGCAPETERHTCPAHGSDYVEYKCKFCCNIATYFCWGRTHFCADCHRRQDRGEYLTRMPLSAHPVCEGKAACPLGVDHPPNGSQEFALGCTLCKDDYTSAKLPAVRRSLQQRS